MVRTSEAFSRPTLATSSFHSFCSLHITSSPSQNHGRAEPLRGQSQRFRRPDLAVFTAALSKGERFRLSRSSLFLKRAHIMGVIQAKVAKDRKSALSTGWDLRQDRTRHQHEKAGPRSWGNGVEVKTPTVGRRSGRVSASGGSGSIFRGEALRFHPRPGREVVQQSPPTAFSIGIWFSGGGLAQRQPG